MKKGIHPEEYRLVAFRDMSNGHTFITRSCLLYTSYSDMEMSWVGDFNPKMIALFKSFGAKHTLTHLTMRYLFDPEKELKRAEVI